NGVFLIGSDGRAIASSGGIDPATLPPSFKMTAESSIVGGQAAVSDTLHLTTGDVDVIAVIVPVFSNPDPAANTGQGTPTSATATQTASGALGAFVSVERLVAAYQPATGFSSGTDISIALITSSARIVSIPGRTSDPSQILVDGKQLETLFKAALGGQRAQTQFTDPNGLDRMTVAVPISLSGNDWAAVVSGPSTRAYGPNDSLLQRALVAAIVAILLSVLGALAVVQWISRPLRTLNRQAYDLSQGGPDTALGDDAPKDAIALANTIRDMADRLRAQIRDTETAREEIARQAEQLRDLLRRTVRLQEDERRRIASDIHDAVSPLITGALYQSNALRLSQTNGNGHADFEDGGTTHIANAQELQEVADLLERAMTELHDVIFDLRPPDLDDIGVVAAVQRHVDQVNRSGLPCTLEVIGEELRLPPEVRLAVYRIVQEALHNAVRHARADEALVRIEWLGERLRVTVQDNGSGFDLSSDRRRTGLGLLSMRERASSIGARLEIISRPGSGTAIIVERATSDIDLTLAEPQPVPDLGFDATTDSNDDSPIPADVSGDEADTHK
ncbi:MAG TPA: HAMP domain-containing sensor histidine kinase, partial [Thermomicrobiales bacterium]|nr:HAMP domain-containing sensor histidine kinase [Thermomicrobiales bacterium]